LEKSWAKGFRTSVLKSRGGGLINVVGESERKRGGHVGGLKMGPLSAKGQGGRTEILPEQNSSRERLDSLTPRLAIMGGGDVGAIGPQQLKDRLKSGSPG